MQRKLWLNAYSGIAAALLSSPSYCLTLTSNIPPNTSIPVTYTCDGKNISPRLSWAEAPNKTASFALIISDPDAPGGIFYHWVVYDIPNNITHLDEGESNFPVNTLMGISSWNVREYKGPCPPKGTTHHYIFTVYALDKSTLKVAANANAKTILNALQNHILASASFTATFGH